MNNQSTEATRIGNTVTIGGRAYEAVKVTGQNITTRHYMNEMRHYPQASEDWMRMVKEQLLMELLDRSPFTVEQEETPEGTLTRMEVTFLRPLQYNELGEITPQVMDLSTSIHQLQQ